LRQEGLIRQPQRERVLAPSFWQRWHAAWMLPVAAALLVVLGLFVSQRGSSNRQVAQKTSSAPLHTANLATNTARTSEDQQLLDMVGSRSPTMRAQYAANLQNVNAYIRDAEESVQTDPNDEEARHSLMDAYEQRAMVYEMALDRSLP
jgi:thioredoxin-like negative regulator of GroEL